MPPRELSTTLAFSSLGLDQAPAPVPAVDEAGAEALAEVPADRVAGDGAEGAEHAQEGEGGAPAVAGGADHDEPDLAGHDQVEEEGGLAEGQPEGGEVEDGGGEPAEGGRGGCRPSDECASTITLVRHGGSPREQAPGVGLDRGAVEEVRVHAAVQADGVVARERPELVAGRAGRPRRARRPRAAPRVMSGTSQWPMSEPSIGWSCAPSGLTRSAKAHAMRGVVGLAAEEEAVELAHDVGRRRRRRRAEVVELVGRLSLWTAHGRPHRGVGEAGAAVPVEQRVPLGAGRGGRGRGARCSAPPRLCQRSMRSHSSCTPHATPPSRNAKCSVGKRCATPPKNTALAKASPAAREVADVVEHVAATTTCAARWPMRRRVHGDRDAEVDAARPTPGRSRGRCRGRATSSHGALPSIGRRAR